jgi:hypothetical protein
MNGLLAVLSIALIGYFSSKFFAMWLGCRQNQHGEIEYDNIPLFVTAGAILLFLGLVHWFDLFGGFAVFFVIWLLTEGDRFWF